VSQQPWTARMQEFQSAFSSLSPDGASNSYNDFAMSSW